MDRYRSGDVDDLGGKVKSEVGGARARARVRAVLCGFWELERSLFGGRDEEIWSISGGGWFLPPWERDQSSRVVGLVLMVRAGDEGPVGCVIIGLFAVYRSGWHFRTFAFGGIQYF